MLPTTERTAVEEIAYAWLSFLDHTDQWKNGVASGSEFTNAVNMHARNATAAAIKVASI